MSALGLWLQAPVGSTCSLHPLACSIRSVMQKYLEDRGEVTFEKIFSQKLGFLLFRDFCLNHLEEAKPLVEFYEEVRWAKSTEIKVRKHLAVSEAPGI